MVTTSAPGKLMLFGEHAAVYGNPCIVTAVDERIAVTIEQISNDQVIFDTPESKDSRFVTAAISEVAKIIGKPISGIRLTTKSPFSGVYGFGSSSAVTAAVTQALVNYYGKNITQLELFRLAYDTVISVQKIGSGFDVAAAIYGGTIYFLAGGRIIDPLEIRGMSLIVGYTGVKANTVAIVGQVAQKRAANQVKVDRIFTAIAKLVDEAKERMAQGDWERVGKLMDFNQEYLRNLGVSSEKLESLILAAKSAGAWGAKLSGAGGGDCMIALARDDKKQAVESSIEQAGGQLIAVKLNAQGVRLESTDDQEEIFIVVDKEDNIIGHRSRYDCHHNKSLIHRGINLLIFDHRNRVLLQKRSMGKDTNPGYWSTSVGGHVAQGEGYEEAVRRETKEELGVDIPVQFKMKFIHEYDHETEMESFFVGKYNGPFYPNIKEIDQIEFFSKTDLHIKVKAGDVRLTSLAERTLKLIDFL